MPIIWIFWMCDLCVLVGVMCQRVFVEVLIESENKWPNLFGDFR